MIKKFDYEGAKKDGYDDEQISDILKKKYSNFDYDKAIKSGKSNEEINRFLSNYGHNKKVSSLRSAVSAPIKGLIQGIQEQAKAFSPYISGLSNSPISEQFQQEQLDKNLPVKREHEGLQRAGRLLPIVAGGEGSIPLKAAQLGVATIAGELAKESGIGQLGQTITEAFSMGIPGIAKALSGTAIKATKAISSIVKAPAEKTSSGLTKLSSTEAKASKLGTLSKERQKQVFEKLDKEASKLAKSSLSKHVPITKDLESGVDVYGDLSSRFTELENTAKKANPTINIKHVNDLFADTRRKYSGIPSPHPDAKKVLKEISDYRNNPPIDLEDSLKIFRSNNRKLKNIYETAQLKGTQKEYADFLIDTNKAITKSIEDTLPSDSIWVKEFKDLNAGFKNLRNAEKTTDQLKGILSERPTTREIDHLAGNKRIQDKLRLSMGQKGSDEVIQIAKDLKEAKDSLKSIPKSELTKFDAIFPLYYAIPFIGKYLGIGKTVQAARYGYGWLLSTPARRRAYGDLIKSLKVKDIEGYKSAALLLNKELDKE